MLVFLPSNGSYSGNLRYFLLLEDWNVAKSAVVNESPGCWTMYAFVSITMLLSFCTYCSKDGSWLCLQKLAKSFCWLGCLLLLPWWLLTHNTETFIFHDQAHDAIHMPCLFLFFQSFSGSQTNQPIHSPSHVSLYILLQEDISLHEVDE